MKQVLIWLQPLDKPAGVRRDIRVGDGPTGENYGALGQVWEPAIITRPQLSIELFNVDLDGGVSTGRAQFALQLKSVRAVADPAALYWNGAPVVIYGERAGQADGGVEFVGFVRDVSLDVDTGRINITAEVSDALLDRPLLTKTFTGGGGIGGDAGRRGVLLPAGFGSVKNIEPIWFDLVRNIGMIDGYGNTQSIDWLGEGLSSFGRAVHDYETYEALAAAIDAREIRPGEWAKCTPLGLVGLGAPPVAPITVHAVFGANRPGALIRRVCTQHAAIAPGLIDTAAFDFLDQAVNRPVHYWTADDRNVKDLAEAVAQSCNATLLVDFAGRVTITRAVPTPPVMTIDRTGGTDPRVIRWRGGAVQPPFAQIRARTSRPARVLRLEEVNYTDTLEDRGLYLDSESYRPGNIVWLSDGSQWLYVNEAPGAGNSPAAIAAPATSDAYWQRLQPPKSASDFRYANGVLIEALRPAEPGANVTENRVAQAVQGQGTLATRNGVIFNAEISGLPIVLQPGNLVNGNYLGAGYLYYDNGGTVQFFQPAEPGANITENRIASGFSGQGQLATQNAVTFGTQIAGLPAPIQPGNLTGGGFLDARQMQYWGGPALVSVNDLRPGEAGANVTEGRISAAVAGQGTLATQNAVDWRTQVGGAGRPADYATVGAPIGTYVGTVLVESLLQTVTDTSLSVGALSTEIDAVNLSIDGLVANFGSSVAAAASAEAAQFFSLASQAARDGSQAARDVSQAARDAAQLARDLAQSHAGAAGADAAVARNMATLASSFAAGNLLKNGVFADPAWTAAAGSFSAPPNWPLWSLENGAYHGKWPGGAGKYGPYAFQIDRNNGAAGVYQDVPLAAKAGRFAVELEVGLEDGAFSGAGMLFYALDAVGNWVATVGTISFAVDKPVGHAAVPTTNGIYQYAKLFAVPDGAVILRIYLMAGWTGFTGTQAGFLRTIWHKAVLRNATQAEIDGAQALIDSTANTARLTIEEATRSTQVDALAGRSTALEAVVNNPATGVAATAARVSTEEAARSSADIALGARSAALEAVVNTGANSNASLRAGISDEAVVRATADAALSGRVSTVEAVVNDAGSGVAATLARLVTEEATRASADGALATRTTNLEAVVNHGSTGVAATSARLTSEEATRAAADSALAVRSTTLESQVTGASPSGLRMLIEQQRRNQIDLSWWRAGAFIPWAKNDGAEDYIYSVPNAANIWGISAPDGSSGDIWLTRANAAGGPGGGWNSGPVLTLDPDRTYRFAVPIIPLAPANVVQAGTAYWGTHAVCDLNTTSLNNNPYFASLGRANMVPNRWHLFVGYVFPRESTGKTHDGAGVWDMVTGARINPGTNWCFHPDGRQPIHRAYQFYANPDAYQGFGRPVVELIDGNETPLTAILGAALGVTNATARLTIEEATRSTQVDALAGRSTALEAVVNNPATGVAATAARVSNGEAVQAEVNSALASRASSLETRAGSLESSVTTQSQSIADLKNGASGFLQTQVNAGTANAFLVMRASTGAPVPVTLVNQTGTATTATTITKIAQIASWESGSAISAESYTGPVRCAWQAGSAGIYAMAGLTSDPLANTSYETIDHAWYADGRGVWIIYENGAGIVSFPANFTTDVVSIEREGTIITYRQNGVIRRTVAIAANVRLYFDSAIYSPGATIKNIVFTSATDTSNVSLGAREIHLYNTTAGGAAIRTLSLENGAALFSGNLAVGGKILVGSGAGFDIALKPKLIPVTDGQSVSYPSTGTIPEYSLSPLGLAPLGSGETYSLYLENQTASGATVRLKINVPGTPTSNVRTVDEAGGPGGAGRQISKGSGNDSASGNYTISFTATAFADGYQVQEGFWAADLNWRIDIYGYVGGVWVMLRSTGGTKRLYDFNPGQQVQDVSETLTVTAPTGVTYFAVVAAYGCVVATINELSWQSAGTASSIRTASPNGESCTLTIMP